MRPSSNQPVMSGLASALPLDGEFDYIIVGGGTAGCTLASRLSEDPAVTVCLLEAGGRGDALRIQVPGAVGFAHMAPDLGWSYSSVPQPGLHGRRINLARGRVLGGTSAINGMVYFRGPATDYDEWRRLGNEGWGYDEVLPYFLRSEDNFDWPESRLHHKGGPLAISSLAQLNPLVPRFLHAADSLGYPRCNDFNVAAPEGFGARQLTIRAGRRETASTAFLEPVRGRNNLAIVTGALTHRIVFESRRAVGVEAESGGALKILRARREVVLCAGAYNTPQVLLRSGVGPGEELRALGIAPVAHSVDVGKHLRDHVSAFVQVSSPATLSYALSLRALPRCAWNLLEYALWRRGPLASNLFEAAGFVRSQDGIAGPDVHIVLNAFRRPPAGRIVPTGHGCAVLATVLQPFSEGSVVLGGTDPRDAPLIDPGFLQDERDLRTIVRGLKIARNILNSAAFSDLQHRETDPGHDVRTDDDWAEYARRNAFSVYHPGGSCRMGPDAQSVVDTQLRVRGVERLRIADASIYPTLISGNTNASVMMIAEKAADLLLGNATPTRMPARTESPAETHARAQRSSAIAA